MSDRVTLAMFNPQQGYQELLKAWAWAKSMLFAGHRLVLTIQTERKSRPQEKHYHALIGDIAGQVKLGDRLWDAEDAKRILVSAFREDTKNDPDLSQHWAEFGNWQLVPGIRGEFVVIGVQTRKFPKPLASAFIEWLLAFGAEHDVKWSRQVRESVDPETGEIREHS